MNLSVHTEFALLHIRSVLDFSSTYKIATPNLKPASLPSCFETTWSKSTHYIGIILLKNGYDDHLLKEVDPFKHTVRTVVYIHYFLTLKLNNWWMDKMSSLWNTQTSLSGNNHVTVKVTNIIFFHNDYCENYLKTCICMMLWIVVLLHNLPIG